MQYSVKYKGDECVYDSRIYLLGGNIDDFFCFYFVEKEPQFQRRFDDRIEFPCVTDN